MDDAPTTPGSPRATGTRVLESSSTYVPTTHPGLRRAELAGERGQKLGRREEPAKHERGDAVGTPESVGDLRVAEVDRRREARCHVPAEGAELRDEGCFLLPPDGCRVGDDRGAAPSQFAVRIAPKPRHVLSFVGVEAIDVRGGVPQGELLGTGPGRYEDHLRVLAGELAEHERVRLADRADDGVDALDLDEPTRLFDEDRVLAFFGAPPDQLDVTAGNPGLGDASGRLPVRKAGTAPEQRQLGAGEHLVLVAGEDPATVREQADPHRLLAARAARCAHSERRDGQQTSDPSEINSHRRSPTGRPRQPRPRVAARLRRSGRRPRRCPGRCVTTVPSIVLVTHTEPAPAATPLVPRPVGIVAVMALVSGSIRNTRSSSGAVTQTPPSPAATDRGMKGSSMVARMRPLRRSSRQIRRSIPSPSTHTDP